jgi:hypothetical protein
VPRGPLPNPDARRRNAPRIPTTSLPSTGRKGAAPRPPKAYVLGDAGTAWWRWAWKTPQAAAWSAGDLYFLARRARLEDDLASLDRLGAHHLSLPDFLEIPTDDRVEAVELLITTLHRLAGGELAIIREAREMDKVIGLTPKAMAELRWKIEDTEDRSGKAQPAPATVRRLRAVDPEAATGA